MSALNTDFIASSSDISSAVLPSLETFYTETSEPQPNPTLDIFVYNTTTDARKDPTWPPYCSHSTSIFSKSWEWRQSDKTARWGLETFVTLQKRIRNRIYDTTSLFFCSDYTHLNVYVVWYVIGYSVMLGPSAGTVGPARPLHLDPEYTRSARVVAVRTGVYSFENLNFGP